MNTVRFTKHANEKAEVLRKLGFDISKELVSLAIQQPDKTEKRGAQKFSMKILNERLAEERKGIIPVITFYPVERKRHGI